MNVPILPTISTTCIVISAILVAIGWRLIWKRRIGQHKKTMLWAAVFAVTFFLIYASRTIFIGNTAFGGPASVKVYYTIFLIFHITLATVGGVLGLVQIITGLRDKYNVHRKVGPIASVVWFFTAITGVAVYILLYVLYPGGETTSLIKATFGL
ncbi:membrane protein [Staphylococcus schleiferi]|nr:membrane protein [Staphylococcus schleiferi]